MTSELSEEQLRALLATARAASASAKLANIVGRRIADVLKAPSSSQSMIAAAEWLVSPAWCLALLGGVGNGKSVAAGWLARAELERGGSVCWIRATEASTASLYGPEAAERSKRARTSDLLVVDDLGAELASAPWASWLSDVLDARYANLDRAVLTSNLDAAAFKERVGPRLADRIREGKVVGTSSVSMRQRGGN